MSKKLVVLFLTFAIFIMLASGIYVVGGTLAYMRYQQEDIAAQAYCDGQTPVRICVHAPKSIFSAFYRSYMSTQYSLFSVDYSSSSPKTLLISIAIKGFSQSQVQTVTATGNTQTRSFIPPMQDQALQMLTTDKQTAVDVHVTDTQGQPFYVQDVPVTLYSRWLMRWLPANHLQIAAWVTPDDPAVAQLVSKARTHLAEQEAPVPRALIGYLSASPQQVVDQVDAIYDTLRLNYQMHYVQEDIPYGSGSVGDNLNQNIRLPAEILQEHSGMCIELTNLLASAVERIGLHAEIVIIPGHAFLGVATTRDNKSFEYWDAVDMNNNIAADSANVHADAVYRQHARAHTLVETILVSDARNAHVGPML
ncbi:MAG TPA: hypothetical protein VHV10_14410 [Ktedonobacteraceae bacterium]|nr:hypothetical protein [Ktedonobacteraceae bacterium]